MKESTERQLRALLEQHDREYLAKLEAESEWARESETFDQRFEAMRESVIQPVMAEFKSLLDEHGLESRIVVDHRLVQSDGLVKPAKIAFEFLVHTELEYQGLVGSTPSLTYISEAVLGKVLIQEDSMLPYVGGHRGVIAECGLDEITPDLVEAQLLAISEKILKGTEVS